jgi:hypothetical protein
MPRSRRLLPSALAAVLLVTPAPLPASEPVMLAPERHADWQAIGRLNRAGYKSRRMCTATLVAPDLVLSAAHCVVRSGGEPIPPGELRFVAGCAGSMQPWAGWPRWRCRATGPWRHGSADPAPGATWR